MASYTASIAVSDGGFGNWNWSDFGFSAFSGAMFGFISGGIGAAFGPVGTVANEVGRAAAHGSAGFVSSSISGGNGTSGFWAGAASSLVGSLGARAPILHTDVGGAIFAAGVGGGASAISGGDFIMGAGQGLGGYLLNHLPHKQGEKGAAQKTTEASEKISLVKEIYDQGTFVPGTVASYTNTKLGKVMSMGGSYAYKASSYAKKRAFVRESAYSSKYIKTGGSILGGIGIALTGADVIQNGFNTSNSLDLIMGSISFIPGWGWVVGGVYFVGNTAIQSHTGKNIGQHLDGL